MLHGIVELWLVHKTVDNLLVLPLPLKGAKEAIPDDQHSSIVLVQAITVGSLIFNKFTLDFILFG